MTIEEKPTEVAPEVAPLSKEQPVDLKKIAVDIAPGVSIELDVDTARKVIQHRDSRTKGFKELETKLQSAEAQAKNEASRNQLLESMKSQNVEEVERQVGAKYEDTIKNFQKKVFNSEIKGTLAKLGIISDGLDDATKLVMADAKVELTGEEVTLNGIKVEDYLKDWVAKKPHLVSVKQVANTTKKHGVTGTVPPKQHLNNKQNIAAGLGKLFK